MIFYELLVLLGWLAYLPKLLFQKWKQKKIIPSLADRLGLPLPPKMEGPVFWIHAVSLGEMKAARPLCKKIQKQIPNAVLFLTTATSTGKKEAESISPFVRYLPLDLSWIQRAWMKRLRPKLLIIVEGDLWPNMLKEAKKAGTKIALISGKISERSFKRLLPFKSIAHLLYGKIDHLLMQNTEYAMRLQVLCNHPSISVTGNIKLASIPPKAEPLQLLTKLPIVTLSCTHVPEEKELLPYLLSLPIFLILAPRHPERFHAVANLLTSQQISFCRFTSLHLQTGAEQVLLLDTIGKLPDAYSASVAAILGGSFSSEVGGHNPLEPLSQGTPVYFGPHMHLQKGLAHIALDTGFAFQVDAASLPQLLQKHLQAPKQDVHLSLAKQGVSILENTWSKLESMIS